MHAQFSQALPVTGELLVKTKSVRNQGEFSNMTERPQLCILSPDAFYAMQFHDVEFPSFESHIFQSLEELEQCPKPLMPAICLVFGSHFSRLSLAETLLFIRTRFRAAKIVQV